MTESFRLRRRRAPVAASVERLVSRLLAARVDPEHPAPFAGAKSTPEDLWSIALLNAWAEALDVLTFYQARIRAEGYADTAVEALSRKLLRSGIGIERAAMPPLAVAKPGEPVPLILDPGRSATADFVLRLRAAPGLPTTAWLPAGSQLRHHAADAPSVTIFETDAPVSLRPEWNDLPLLGSSRAVPTGIGAGAPGVLVGTAGSLPRPGDHLIAVARRDPKAWAFRQVATVTANPKAGLGEVTFDRPMEADLAEPEVAVLPRRTPLFGWNAAEFSTLPAGARRRAVRGIEDTLPGGLRVETAGHARVCNAGLPDGTPRALAVGTDGTVYLATDDGIGWLGPDRIWRRAERGAAGRGVSCLATAPDGLLMVGGANGQAFTTYDPARGFDRLSGGFVLTRQDAGLGPVKAALAGGAVRGLMAFGSPPSRIVALTDGGLFEYDPRGFWLTVTAQPGRDLPVDGTASTPGATAPGAPVPLPTLLDGVRLAAALVTDDRRIALLAYGATVSAVDLGAAVAPSSPVFETPGPTSSTADTAAETAPAPRSTPWGRKHWRFDGPVLDLAPLASHADDGWSRFLARTADGVFLCDRTTEVPRAVPHGLPDEPIQGLVATRSGQGWRVRAVGPAGVHAFDAETATWRLESAAETAGPVLAAANGETLAVFEPLALPEDWPGFGLPPRPELDLATPGLDLPPGSPMVLVAQGGATLPATVVGAKATAFAGFGLRERGMRVSFEPSVPFHPAAFDRRTTMVHLGGRPLALVTPPRAPTAASAALALPALAVPHGSGLSPAAAAPGLSPAAAAPGRQVALAGAWNDLLDTSLPPAAPTTPTSGVAGAGSLPLILDGRAGADAWGVQPSDLAGVAAAMATPTVAPSRRRVALTGRAACVVPAALGGVLRPGAEMRRRDLPGFDVRALLAVGDLVVAASAGQGVHVRRAGIWSSADDGLAGSALRVDALAAGRGVAPRIYLATADGIYGSVDADAGGALLRWSRLAPPPPTPVAALAVLAADVVLAGGAAGVFAWTGSAWISGAGGALGAGTAVTALVRLGDRALVAPAAGGVLVGGPRTGWTAWTAGLEDMRISALCTDGTTAWLAAPDGVYAAVPGMAAPRRLDAAGATALAVAGARVAVATAGDGVWRSEDGGARWTRSAVGLNNDLTSVTFDGDGGVLAGAGARLWLRDASGVRVPLAGPKRSALASAAIVGALDAGLCSPLRAALAGGAGGEVADDAVVTVVEPGRRWIAGSPGQGLGTGASMLDLEHDGVAVRRPAGAFTVVDVAGAEPWGLSLAGDAGAGFAEAWPEDLVFVAPKADAPALTVVRTLVGGRVSADGTSTTLVLDRALGSLLDPASLRLTANVASATQGETVAGEVLGDGDASRSFQAFRLRRAPLTFTAEPGGGSSSTLRVYVDGVEWRSVGSLAGAGPSERVYLAKVVADERTEVTFGDGITGARLSSGRGNVRATYRAGMRDVGDLAEGVTTLLAGRPSIAAVRGIVRTPARLPVDGQADAPIRPVVLRSTGRLVTAGDYADFAETLPLVAAARADRLRIRGRPWLCLSIAWAGPRPEAEAAEVALARIRAAIAGSQSVPATAFEVGVCTPVPVRVAAQLWLSGGADADAVGAAARAALARLLGDGKPVIGRPVLRTEVEETLQALAGVSGVAVDAFHDARHPARSDTAVQASPARVLASGAFVPAQMLVVDRTEAGIHLTLREAA